MADPATPRSRTKTGLIGVGILVIALGFGLPQLLSGNAPSIPTTSAPAETTPDFGWSLARLIGGLVLVCVLCVALTRFLGRRPDVPTSSALTLLASVRVDARCGLYLVGAGERRLLVGLDPGGVKALVEMPGQPPVQSPAPIPAEIDALVASFRVPADPTRRF